MNNSHLTSGLLRSLRRNGSLLLVAVAGLGAAVAGAAEAAQRAYDFTNAVGVRMDLGGDNYMAHWAAAKSALTGAKIKYVRTGAQDLGWNTDKQGRVTELIGLGIKFDYLFGDAGQDTTAMQNAINWTTAAARISGALSFEGPNEWSKHYYQDSPHDLNWDSEVFAFQQALRNGLRNGSPAPWPTGPILCATAWQRDRYAYRKMKEAHVDNYCSVGTLHYYHLNSVAPTSTRAIVDHADGDFSETKVTENMDQAMADQQGLKAGTWVTETGEQQGLGGEGGNAVSLTVAAKYVPRLIAEFFNRSATKVFIFELMDQSPGNYGLLDATGAQRPAYTSVKNMMTLLDDPTGTTFAPGSMTLTFTGAPADLRHLVLQKKNGVFYVLAWRDVVSDNLDDNNDQTQLFTLDWGFTASAVDTYLPKNSTTAVNHWTSRRSVQLNARDHILITKITP